MNVAIIGASGLLGSACFRIFDESSDINVIGTFRDPYDAKVFFHNRDQHYVLSDALNIDELERFFETAQPSVVINCTSLSKSELQRGQATQFIPIYCMLPHLLADFSERFAAKFIQISSDGVFSGDRGNYAETDLPDATDLYGRAKLLGEVDYPHCVTLRTSMLGHDALKMNGLVSWFLDQRGSCVGYTKAVFSGFPVSVLARIFRDYILPIENLTGVYHLASEPISKFDLLKLISEIYNHEITIIPDAKVEINRSLNPAKFNSKTGFSPCSWGEMVKLMHNDHFENLGKWNYKNV